MNTKKKIIPLHYSIYFWPVVIIAIIGLSDSIYLSLSHYRVYMDIGYQSFCAISKAINCDTVSQSPFSIFFGLPVPVWGVVGYTFFLLFLPIAWSRTAEKKRIWSLLFLVALLFSIYSIILAAISTFYIHSYCIMCVASYAVNFLLLFYVWIIRKRFDELDIIEGIKQDITFLWENKIKYFYWFSPFFIVLIFLWFFFPSYWKFSSPPVSSEIAHGVTEDGNPWIGAGNPILEITEFADYQCFQCKKMHFFLRQLINNYPSKIRLIHRHFPMDHKFNPTVKQPFHIGSGTLALLAISAAENEKFWNMNDILFDTVQNINSIDIERIAERAGMNTEGILNRINSSQVRLKLSKDIRRGIELGITGTPGYLINGEVYNGNIPSDILRKVINYND